MKLHVPQSPCASCPYRRDTPPGIWHPEEYEKLQQYDDDAIPFQETATFLCHYSTVGDRESVCRGWLTVHRESIAARLCELIGQVTGAERYAVVLEPLYETGREAMESGIRAVARPGRKAVEVIRRLAKTKEKSSKRKQ